MSSLPPRTEMKDPHNLSHTAHFQQATQRVNRFAKRDPALYPLSFIVVAGLACAGYFFMSKSTETEPHRALLAGGMVNPWDGQDKMGTNPNETALFKYRHKTREGHMEDSLPPLNEDIRQLKEGMTPKFKTT